MPKTAAQLKKEKARQAKLEKFQKKQEALKAKAAAQVLLILSEILPYSHPPIPSYLKIISVLKFARFYKLAATI